ncbi:MAG TPA: type II toxin-antitoxin system ParD family antitoxin [Planctomycetota bacterium]|nr:type II toxin-antitoxin system ParD family antitoxin [Planctomycetota bacterium]
MNISLPPELTRLIQDQIATGQFRTAGEVVREALLRLANDDLTPEERRADLRRKIAEGLAASKAGRVKSGELVMKRLHAKLSRLERARRKR